MIDVRINNIECREYTSIKSTEPFYEIIKWQPNSYYNKLQDYLNIGYVESFGGDFIEMNDRISIPKSLFYLSESCFMIAKLQYDEKEHDVKLFSIGSRLLGLSKDEQRDFFKVYSIANKRIYKKHYKK